MSDFTVKIEYKNKDLETVIEREYEFSQYTELLNLELMRVIAETEDAFYHLTGEKKEDWDNETKTATVLFGARVISMTIGQKHMVINGVNVAMLAAPVIVESRTFLPLRAIANVFGIPAENISYFRRSKTVNIIKE